MWVVAFALGYVGFNNYNWAFGQPRPVLDNLYLSLQLFGIRSGNVVGPIGPALQVARFLAPAVALYTALMAVATILQEEIKMVRSRFLSNHTVICGLGRKGSLLAKGLREEGERVIVIEQDENNSLLGQCKEEGSIVMIGNATDPSLLRRARVEKARLVLSVCGEDGVNAEVAVKTRELVSNRKGEALSCIVHIFYLPLRDLLRELEMMMGRPDSFRLQMFNVFETGARRLLQEYPPFDQAEENRAAAPHIVVVGVGWFGETVVANAARMWWDSANTEGKRVRVSLIDIEADVRAESLWLQYPQLESACELIPRQVDIRSPEFTRAEFLFDGSGKCDVNMVYVCLDDDTRSLAAALSLYQQVKGLNIPIVVRMEHEAGLAALIGGTSDERGEHSNLHAFGFFDHTCTPDLILGCTYEILARASHEQYYQGQIARGITRDQNPSVVPWEELSEEMRESNRRQAEHISIKLEAIGCAAIITSEWYVPPFLFSPEEIELMARMEHERYVAERLSRRWSRGEKVRGRKTNPTLVSWDELPEQMKDIDRDYVRGIPSMLSKARFRVYRVRGEDFLERLARLAHEVFCDSLRAEGYAYGPVTSEQNKTHSSLLPYTELPNSEKEANRRFVRDIPNKLETVGYVLIPATREAGSREFSKDEIDVLAQMEHQRWMREKLAQGWRHGETTNKENKVHSLLVSREYLPPEEKDKNSASIQSIPAILAKAGYTMIHSGRPSRETVT